MAVLAKLGFGSAVVQEVKGHGGLSNPNRSEKRDGCDLICSVQYLVYNFLSGKTVLGGRWEDRKRGASIVTVDAFSRGIVFVLNIGSVLLAPLQVAGAGITIILHWIPCSCLGAL